MMKLGVDASYKSRQNANLGVMAPAGVHNPKNVAFCESQCLTQM